MQENTNPLTHTPQDIYDITGQAFNGRVVIALERITNGRRYWRVQCLACGEETVCAKHYLVKTLAPCWKCYENQLVKEGKGTPQWMQDWGFDVTFLSRFWPNVEKEGPIQSHTPELGPCWEWTAGVTSKGYGSISMRFLGTRAQLITSHRAAWIIQEGREIPEGMNVLHKCDYRRCVRPSHFFLGTIRDNNTDRAAKGRDIHAQGMAHANSKLTDEQVLKIRKFYKDGCETYKSLAEQFKCSRTLIAVIVRGENWRHLL